MQVMETSSVYSEIPETVKDTYSIIQKKLNSCVIVNEFMIHLHI